MAPPIDSALKGRRKNITTPSTHISLQVHVVFSTKSREPRIAQECRDQLHAYMGGLVHKTNAVPEAIGGVDDHVHLLLGISATARLSDVVREIKAASSKWIHEEIGDSSFAWQEGYGAFGVSPSKRNDVRAYEHHRIRSFQEEYLELLNRCGVEYDAQHLW